MRSLAFSLEGGENVGRLEGEEVRGCWCRADAGREREPAGVVDGEFFPCAERANASFVRGRVMMLQLGLELWLM